MGKKSPRLKKERLPKGGAKSLRKIIPKFRQGGTDMGNKRKSILESGGAKGREKGGVSKKLLFFDNRPAKNHERGGGGALVPFKVKCVGLKFSQTVQKGDRAMMIQTPRAARETRVNITGRVGGQVKFELGLCTGMGGGEEEGEGKDSR